MTKTPTGEGGYPGGWVQNFNLKKVATLWEDGRRTKVKNPFS